MPTRVFSTRARRLFGGFGLLALVALGTVQPGDAAVTNAPVASGTFLGPNGVEARWVIAENERPGTTAWKITAAPKRGFIEGFAAATYVADGQSLRLYVETSARSFRVEAYRMGFYGGKGARLVWRSAAVKAKPQPACSLARATNTVSCADWHPSLTVAITSSFVQGDYLLKLVGAGNEQSYIPVTVWDPDSHAAYFVKNDVFTWQAWNDFGGYDFYAGEGSCTPTYPPCNRARVVSYDRPYDYGEGAGDFLAEELPLVEFAEKRGLDVTYGTDVTIEQHPSVLEAHRVLLSLGHDECWSLVEREAAEDAATEHGLNVVFFGASPILRHVRLASSPLGPDRLLVDYRNPLEDPLDGKGDPLEVTGNTWASPPTSWSEVPFVGDEYAGYLQATAPHAPFVVADASAWVFAGTHLKTGDELQGVLASDYDTAPPPSSRPSGLEIFGHSLVPGTSEYSDMTYYSMPKSHAGILDTGTNNWIPALSACGAGHGCASPMIDRITRNILYEFGLGPAGLRVPSNG